MLSQTATFQTIKEKNKKLNFKERASSHPVIRSLPLVAKIEVTSRCNLRCVMCVRRKDNHVKQDLDFSLFKKLEPIFPTLLSAYLYGIGEVLLYKRAMNMFRYLCEFDINVGFITNGLLISQEIAEEWVQKGLYKLSVSLDGASRETYEKIRRGASFAHLLKNIALVNELKKQYRAQRPLLTFNFIMMKDTIRELPDLIDLAASYNVREVIVSDLIAFFDDMKAQVVSYNDSVCQNSLREAKMRAQRNGVRLVLPVPYCFQQERHENESTNGPTSCKTINPCTEPWSGFWLTGEGIVTPCCYWMKPMGDLKCSDFLTIWNNAQYQSLRKTVNTGKRIEHCRRCAIAGMEQRK